MMLLSFIIIIIIFFLKNLYHNYEQVDDWLSYQNCHKQWCYETIVYLNLFNLLFYCIIS